MRSAKMLWTVIAAGLMLAFFLPVMTAGAIGTECSNFGDCNVAEHDSTLAAKRVTGATPFVYRETANLISIGTSASPCLNAGTTASSAAVTAGTYRLHVMSETISLCMAPDVNCDTGVLDLVPGTQIELKVASGNAGTWYCRSAGGTGYATLRSP